LEQEQDKEQAKELQEKNQAASTHLP